MSGSLVIGRYCGKPFITFTCHLLFSSYTRYSQSASLEKNKRRSSTIKLPLVSSFFSDQSDLVAARAEQQQHAQHPGANQSSSHSSISPSSGGRPSQSNGISRFSFAQARIMRVGEPRYKRKVL